jgi:hypothetical protein
MRRRTMPNTRIIYAMTALMTLLVSCGRTGPLERMGKADPNELANAIIELAPALETASGEKLEKNASLNLMLAIVKMDRLYSGSKIRSSRVKAYAKRLRSLPNDAVSEWSQVAGTNKTMSALSLIQVDPFFSWNKFQERTFKKAIALNPTTRKFLMSQDLNQGFK